MGKPDIPTDADRERARAWLYKTACLENRVDSLADEFATIRAEERERTINICEPFRDSPKAVVRNVAGEITDRIRAG